ncbi:cytochrome c1 [Roseovarius pelagicus]|uniref:Cytochrome c1 n=1 Tax=Roseovarius pelagicus TaxID=2980108 RepID=A0ABY6D7Z9_9RHOB|nr:cytochrome c1 [Roseovarius pelagicus]UXX82223.1 cytochrome c1 [Roseovarius pelagicus]
MFKKIGIAAVAALTLSAGGAFAAGGGGHVEDVDFSFEGPFGKFDQNQLQRGLKVYTMVCASCHGLQYVPIRTLADEGGPHLPADQVRAYAEQFEVFDKELDDFRPAKPVDHFPGSALDTAPDLSLMAKKRAGFHGPLGSGFNQLVKGMGGPEYIVTLLTGYHEAPECAPEDFPGSYNVAFAAGGYPDSCKNEDGSHMVPGSWIAMAQPLYGEDVDFDDGHDNSLHHTAEDVAAFLMWTAEPKLMARKNAGLTGVIFLTLLSVLLYLTNKRIWAPIKGKNKKTS